MLTKNRPVTAKVKKTATGDAKATLTIPVTHSPLKKPSSANPKSGVKKAAASKPKGSDSMKSLLFKDIAISTKLRDVTSSQKLLKPEWNKSTTPSTF